MTDDIPLDVIGAIEGTDKSSAIHDYLRHYETLFAPLRHAPIRLLEIGVLGGASLRIWEQFFTRAEIIGVDINPDARRHAGGRVRVEIGSQADPAFLEHLCRTHTPTIIIDDGSHMADHVIFTFEQCFPALPPGGIYVVEDLYFHLGPQASQYRGASPIGPGEYFTRIASRITGRVIDPAENAGMAQYTFRHVDRLQFLSGMVVLHKAPAADGARLAAQAEQLAASRGTATAWFGAAGLMHHHGAAGPALAAAERSVELDPHSEHCRRLGAILIAAGEMERARAALEGATKQAPGDAWCWFDRGILEERMGAPAEAEPFYRRALELAPGNPIFSTALARAQGG